MRTAATLIFFILVKLVFAYDSKPASNLNTAATVGYLSPLEKEIICEINLFRSNPAKYADDFIAPLTKKYKGKLLYYPDDKPLLTKEGAKAINECVSELKKASPLSILYPNQPLSRAAADHAKDQSKSGKTGHYGSDGSTSRKRIERYGNWQVRIAENIAYGGITARQIVIYLLVDDGQYDRGHRKNFLQPDFKLIGVATANHPVYNNMCVMDFAGGMAEK